jgi:hypothetical protein
MLNKRQVENVVVTIPFPKAVGTSNLTASYGTVFFDEATKVRRIVLSFL